jgi:hypothetical protein
MHELSCCAVTQSFLDLTNLVAPQTSSKGAFDDLAYTVCALPLLPAVTSSLRMSTFMPLETTIPVF